MGKGLDLQNKPIEFSKKVLNLFSRLINKKNNEVLKITNKNPKVQRLLDEKSELKIEETYIKVAAMCSVDPTFSMHGACTLPVYPGIMSIPEPQRRRLEEINTRLAEIEEDINNLTRKTTFE